MSSENVIKFWPWDGAVEELIPAPVPAIKSISEAWKNFPRYLDKAETRQTVKHCMPFFDAMTSGYIFTLPTDVEISIIQGNPTAKYDYPVKILETRSRKEITPPIGYYPVHFSWQMWWGIKTPPGWSALVTQPVNHHDLPFHVTAGIVDYDVYMQPGNIGFFVIDGFEGVIPKGTPMFQVIPIKREEWVMEIDRSLSESGRAYNEKKVKLPHSEWQGHYKKQVRVDKKYS